ncbi:MULTISPECIES: DegT/DnrJ/EryC1/StrS family aminotransferase [Flavobacteriaceae]|uniref:DegT/DnrJ/EryC1/StrS family aminotransferase n=1 Tax=Flavobacteriaceae TaxID=49546 RepID=UPI003904B974
MEIPFVNLGLQYESIKSEIDNEIHNVLDETAFIGGERIIEFEKNFANAIGVKHCIGVANGTDAIVIALKMMGISEGDEVIVPANSFIATAEAVTAVGGTVIFVDNYFDTYNIDCEKLETTITSKTKAVIAVHLYGQPADMDKLTKITKKHNLFLIEDSAQGHLAEYKTSSGELKKVGTFGDCATFSFYPGKNLGAYGDAGAITTNNDELARKMRMYANHGRISKYEHEFEGINSRIDGLQAGILNVKLKYLGEWTNKRREIAGYYLDRLSSIDKVTLPVVDLKCNPVWHLFVIRVDDRDGLKEFLESKGISVGVHYPISLPNQPAYRNSNIEVANFTVSNDQQNKLLSLPIFPELTKDKLEYICDEIKHFFRQNK